MIDIKEKCRTDKQVHGIMTRKINDWLSTITDVKFREEIRKNVIVAGGAITSLFTGTKVNDFDVYLRDKEVLFKLAQYYLKAYFSTPNKRYAGTQVMAGVKYIDKGSPETDGCCCFIQSAGILEADDEPADVTVDYRSTTPTSDELTAALSSSEDETGEETSNAVDKELDIGTRPVVVTKPRYRPVFISGNAITLSNGIQVITRFAGEPLLLLELFDYAHTKCYWTALPDKELPCGSLYDTRTAIRAMQSKKLIYCGGKYPLCALFRLQKYYDRGWTSNANTLIKMAVGDLVPLDWNSVDTWEDQLTGVDTLYFEQIIATLKQRKLTGVTIDRLYVCEVIDKMFS